MNDTRLPFGVPARGGCPLCGCHGAHFCIGKPAPDEPDWGQFIREAADKLLTPAPPVAATPIEPNEGTQKARILARLRAGYRGTASNFNLNGIAFRYAARIHELRTKHHFNIKTGPTGKDGVVIYTLIEPRRE